MDKDQDAHVIDILPLACPRCRVAVTDEDAFCPSCGLDLLEGLPQLCSRCGKPSSIDAQFCSGCGLSFEQDPSRETTEWIPRVATEPQEYEDASIDDVPRKRSRTKLAATLVIALIVLAGAAWSAWWFGFRIDHAKFDDGLKSAYAVGAEVQALTDEVTGPEDLSAYAQDMAPFLDETEAIESLAAEVDGSEFQTALRDLAVLQGEYLAELVRLAELPSADARPAEYERAEELSRELSSALQAVADLRGDAIEIERITMNVTPLTSALADLAAYRKEVLAERARIKKKNASNAKELVAVTAVTEQIDGIIARYGDGRGELQDWVTRVRGSNASIQEGYQVLENNVALREQIRSELAGLNAPAPFSADVQALLAVVDDAIAANQAAVRGIDEYLNSFNYWSVFETPGWAEFMEASDRVTDSFASAVFTFESHKEDVVRKLEKKIPLPELPE